MGENIGDSEGEIDLRLKLGPMKKRGCFSCFREFKGINYMTKGQ